MKTLIAAAAMSLMTLPATASIEFDFTGYGDGGQEVLTQTIDGLTVTVTAGAYTFDGATFDPDVDSANPWFDLVVSTQDSTACWGACAIDPGIGVATAAAPWLDPNVTGLTDLLTFTFDRAVRFETVRFGRVHPSDDVDVFVDGVLQSADQAIWGDNSLPLSGSGTQISFGADALGHGKDSFNIQELQVSPVPLPAGLALLGQGLAGMGGVRVAQQRRMRA